MTKLAHFLKTNRQKALMVTVLVFSFALVATSALAALTMSSTTVSSDAALTLTGAATSTWSLSAGNLTVSVAAGAVNLTATGATAGDMTLTVGDDYVANVTGIWDVNVTEGATLDATTVSIDGTDTSNLTVTGSAKNLTLAVAGGGAQVLAVDSAGTGANAVDVNATGTGGGVTVDTTDGAIVITAAGAANGDLTLTVGDDFTLNGATGSVYAIGAATTDGTITIGGTAQTGTQTFGRSTDTNAISIGSGVMGDSKTQTVNIANAAANGTTAGGYTVNIAATDPSAANGVNAVTIGNAAGGAANIVIRGGTSGTIAIGSAAGTGAITLGNSTGAQAINIGIGGTAAKTIVIGDGATTGTTTIKSGSGGTIVQSADDNALTVGANGATNPVLQVDAATGSVATGVKITGAAAGSSVTLATISSGTDEKLLLNSKGRSEIRLNSRTDSTTTGDLIGVQIKPGQGASKTTGNVIGAEISPRLNSGVALAASGSIIGAHIDTYLKGTAVGTVNGDVRGLQIELVTDDAGTRTIDGYVAGLRIRSAFSATGITGNFVPLRIEKPEVQTNSQNYDAVLDLTGDLSGVWNDDPGTEPSTAAGYIKVIIDGQARYIQLYSTAPTD